MKKCKYCGRYMKNKIINCCSCGSEDFDKIMDDKIIMIDAPKEGFHVRTEEVKKQIKHYHKYKMIGLISIPFYLIGLVGLKYPLLLSVYFYVAIQTIFITILLLSIGIIGEKNFKKRLKELENLKYNGKLVKNQHYKVINCNNNYFICDVSFRENNNAKAISMKSDRIFATELFNDDGLVDVLVNPNNYNEHYIAFDIY